MQEHRASPAFLPPPKLGSSIDIDHTSSHPEYGNEYHAYKLASCKVMSWLYEGMT
jgi:hypothetical protein